MLQILRNALAKCIEPLLKRAELLLQHQCTLIRLRRFVAFPQNYEKNRQHADERNSDEKIKQRGHLFVMSSGVEPPLNISETGRESATSCGMTRATKNALSFQRKPPFRALENRAPPHNVRQ